MAFSGNSSEFPYRGGILALRGGFLFTGRYCFIYREVPPHCATKHPYLRLQNQKRTGAKLELELIQTQMAQKPMLRAEVGMRVRCANKASAE